MFSQQKLEREPVCLQKGQARGGLKLTVGFASFILCFRHLRKSQIPLPVYVDFIIGKEIGSF